MKAEAELDGEVDDFSIPTNATRTLRTRYGVKFSIDADGLIAVLTYSNLWEFLLTLFLGLALAGEVCDFLLEKFTYSPTESSMVGVARSWFGIEKITEEMYDGAPRGPLHGIHACYSTGVARRRGFLFY